MSSKDAMDKLKSERLKKEATEQHRRKLAEQYIEHSYSTEAIKRLSEIKFSTFFFYGIIFACVSLLSVFPLTSYLLTADRLSKEKERQMLIYQAEMDKQDINFQKSMLNKFRKLKNQEVKNVTDDELANSQFFNQTL